VLRSSRHDPYNLTLAHCFRPSLSDSKGKSLSTYRPIGLIWQRGAARGAIDGADCQPANQSQPVASKLLATMQASSPPCSCSLCWHDDRMLVLLFNNAGIPSTIHSICDGCNDSDVAGLRVRSNLPNVPVVREARPPGPIDAGRFSRWTLPRRSPGDGLQHAVPPGCSAAIVLQPDFNDRRDIAW